MSAALLENLTVGAEIPPFTTAPITRQTLALYAGASGDHNPIHIDSDFARQAGMGDVFVHGMLSMAYLGQVLTNWAPQTAIREFKTRFIAITHVRDQLTCRGIVTEISKGDGETCVRLQLTATNQQGETKLVGEALVAVEDR